MDIQLLLYLFAFLRPSFVACFTFLSSIPSSDWGYCREGPPKFQFSAIVDNMLNGPTKMICAQGPEVCATPLFTSFHFLALSKYKNQAPFLHGSIN